MSDTRNCDHCNRALQLHAGKGNSCADAIEKGLDY